MNRLTELAMLWSFTPHATHERPSGPRWEHMRQMVMLRDRYRCRLCGCAAGPSGKTGHVDHVVPLAKGGTNEMRNLRLLCVPCHQQVTALVFGPSRLG